MARFTFRGITALALLAAVLLLPTSPPIQAAPAAQTAPCYQAAVEALTARGAIYSQGGALASDPIDPSTGQPYGRTGPDSFDCSGLVWWAYAQAGVDVGLSTHSQLDDGVEIPCTLADLAGDLTSCWALGDLIFLRYSTGQHVAIYVGDGLFMDCYNHAVGCILHDVSQDSFYQSHFYQARRMVSGCKGLTNDPGTPSTPAFGTGSPALEQIPDLVGYVTFIVPQCGACNGLTYDNGLQKEPPPPNDSWGDTFLYPFRWLAVAIKNIIIDLICYLLAMLQIAANFAAWAINSVLYVLNQIWKFLIFTWLTIRTWFYTWWSVVELMRDFFQQVEQFFVMIGAWLVTLYELLLAALALAGEVLLLLLQLTLVLLGLMGWIGGLVLGLVAAILLQLQAPTVPVQLGDTHIIYRMVRGALDGLHASSLGWLLYLAYALAYVAFVVWFSRFLSASREAS